MKDEYLKEWCNFIHHKRFAISTIQTYTSSVEWFLKRAGDSPKELSVSAIRTILLEVDNKNTLNATITAVRQFYLHVFERELNWKLLPYVSRKRAIQPIYEHHEVVKILSSIKNEKQKAMFALLVDCGLRISEPCSILLTDCNSRERSIVLRNCKGDKDRIIYPSEFVWSLIRAYWKAGDGQRPSKYLFEGNKKQTPYTTTSVRAFIKFHCNKSEVKYKKVHSFRRFTGTWSVENGVAETVVANKLGHSSVKTLHKHYLIHSPAYLRNIASPLQFHCA